MNIRGRHRNIAKQLYRRTRAKPHFSSNDLRETRLHEKLGHPNATGAFFRALQREELITDVGREPANQKAANRRRVLTYVWTSRAHGELG
jgi:hypothetical protein